MALLINRNGNKLVFPTDVSAGFNVDIYGNHYFLASTDSGFIDTINRDFYIDAFGGAAAVVDKSYADLKTEAQFLNTDITLSNSRTGARFSLMQQSEVAANVVDSLTQASVPVIGSITGHTNLIHPSFTNAFWDHDYIPTEPSSGVYRWSGEAGTYLASTLSSATGRWLTFEARKISGTVVDNDINAIYFVNSGFTQVGTPVRLSALTTGWVRYAIDATAISTVGIEVVNTDAAGNLVFELRNARMTTDDQGAAFPYGSSNGSSYGADALTSTVTWGAEQTLVAFGRTYDGLFSTAGKFMDAGNVNASNPSSVTFADSVGSINSGYSITDNDEHLIIFDWDASNLGLQVDNNARQTVSRTDYPTGTLQILDSLPGMFTYWLFDRKLTAQEVTNIVDNIYTDIGDIARV